MGGGAEEQQSKLLGILGLGIEYSGVVVRDILNLEEYHRGKYFFCSVLF